jgi:hypothetical protein
MYNEPDFEIRQSQAMLQFVILSGSEGSSAIEMHTLYCYGEESLRRYIE